MSNSTGRQVAQIVHEAPNHLSEPRVLAKLVCEDSVQLCLAIECVRSVGFFSSYHTSFTTQDFLLTTEDFLLHWSG